MRPLRFSDLQSARCQGLTASQVRAMKDSLLVEVSQTLGVCLMAAESMLSRAGWEAQPLVEEYLQDAPACLRRLNLVYPLPGLEEDLYDAVSLIRPAPSVVGAFTFSAFQNALCSRPALMPLRLPPCPLGRR